MKLAGVDHVWFWVSDMDRAVDFYANKLGLSVLRRGDRWTELDGGTVRLGLHRHVDGHAADHGGTAVFLVHDLDAAKAALEERGVVFDEHMGEVSGYARYASFGDPDGNSMQIIEYVSEHG